jgi:hypothetical protein
VRFLVSKVSLYADIASHSHLTTEQIQGYLAAHKKPTPSYEHDKAIDMVLL